jgi:hypothetical protein
MRVGRRDPSFNRRCATALGITFLVAPLSQTNVADTVAEKCTLP